MTLVALGLLMIVGTVAGFVFNGYILFISCGNSGQSRTATHLLLFHLGLMNIVASTLFIVALAPAFFLEDWLNEWSCTFLGPAWSFIQTLILWTVAALNIDKYITIASPLHYTRVVSPGKTCIVLLSIWLLALCLSLSTLLLDGITYGSKSLTRISCIPQVQIGNAIGRCAYVLCDNFLSFLLPILLIGIANCRILVIARHHRHRIVSALWDVTVSAQATVTQQKSHFYLTRYRGRSAAATMVHHVGTLLILYIPYVSCSLYESLFKETTSSAVYSLAYNCISLSPVVHGFVYGVKSKVLRKSFVNMIRRQLYKSEFSCEIQSRAPSNPVSRRSSVTPSITFPFQKQLTRRMSEILVQPSSTPNSIHHSSDHFKLKRQSSECSWKFRLPSGSASRDGTPPPSVTYSPITKFFPSRQTSRDENSEITTSSLDTDSISNYGLQSFSQILPKQSSLDSSQGVVHNTGHRQSLRRELFAKNKQKSLELDLTSFGHRDSSVEAPPRSVSHSQMKGDVSPSIIRPLLMGSDPLSQAKKGKKVSWSSDSFSIFDIITSQGGDTNENHKDSQQMPMKRSRLSKLFRQTSPKRASNKPETKEDPVDGVDSDTKSVKIDSNVKRQWPINSKLTLHENPLMYSLQNGKTQTKVIQTTEAIQE